MKTIHFNTGRHYSAHGQRITATRHDDGRVTFFDHDRMVDGELAYTIEEVEFTVDTVRFAYDNDQTIQTTLSFEDGMTLDGCNSRYEG